MPWLTHEFARAERLDLSFWKHASFFVDKDNHKTFAPQHTPDCGFFLSNFCGFKLSAARFSFQPTLFCIHSEKEHDPNNKKAGQRKNGDSI